MEMTQEIPNGFSAPEIEQALLSMLMQWPTQTFPEADKFKIDQSYFVDSDNRVLFREAERLYRAGKAIDLIALTRDLNERGLLKHFTHQPGYWYVTKTWNMVLGYADSLAPYYCELLEGYHAKRQLIRECSDSINEVQAPGADPVVVLPEVIKKLEGIPINTLEKQDKTFQEIMQEKIDRIEKGEPDADIIPTGIAKLDTDSPLHRGDMPVIAGKRKAGKTAFALSIVLNLLRRGIPVAYFSLEDNHSKIIDRIIAGFSRIPVSRHHVKTMNQEEIDTLSRSILAIQQMPFHLNSKTADLSAICASLRELADREGIQLAVVDYAQIVRVPYLKDVNREQVVAEISRTLRLLAMELGVAILLLSQVNAEGMTRESSSLENDCTALWRIEEVKNEPALRALIIPFQRNGPSGVAFMVTFLGALARIENCEQHQEPT